MNWKLFEKGSIVFGKPSASESSGWLQIEVASQNTGGPSKQPGIIYYYE